MTNFQTPIMWIPSGSHTQISDLSSAQTITIASTDTGVWIQALTNNVRLTLDGTTPTASKGFRIVAGDSPVLIVAIPGTTIKMIEETASASVEYQAAKLQASY